MGINPAPSESIEAAVPELCIDKVRRRNRVFKPTGIEAIGLANPPRRFTQDETFQMAGYTSPRIVNIFRNRDIDFRHFYVEPGQIRQETPGDLNNRYGRGAMETGSRAVPSCLQVAPTKVTDIDFFIVCTSTGYVCPDIGSRLIAHMGLRQDLQRAAIVPLVNPDQIGKLGVVKVYRLICRDCRRECVINPLA